MEIKYADESHIIFDKEFTVYDELALKFSERLNRNKIDYVFVSGYVALLFGRSRMSEDIDILSERLDRDRFQELWMDLMDGFYCHDAPDPATAYHDYLGEGVALRFSETGIIIPNVEFKWVSTEQQREALGKALTVTLRGQQLRISSFEIQIAYKLYLGSDKDIEDARYLFELFRERLDPDLMRTKINELELSWEHSRELLGW